MKTVRKKNNFNCVSWCFYLLMSAVLLGLPQPSSGRMDDPQSRLQVDLQVAHWRNIICLFKFLNDNPYIIYIEKWFLLLYV